MATAPSSSTATSATDFIVWCQPGFGGRGGKLAARGTHQTRTTGPRPGRIVGRRRQILAQVERDRRGACVRHTHACEHVQIGRLALLKLAVSEPAAQRGRVEPAVISAGLLLRPASFARNSHPLPPTRQRLKRVSIWSNYLTTCSPSLT